MAGIGDDPSALAYLRWVRSILEPAKYSQLLKELNALKDQRTNLEGLCTRVKQLFKGHHYLIPGFNNFLSKGYGVALSHEEEAALYLGMAETIHHEVEQTSHSNLRRLRTDIMLGRYAYEGAAPYACKIQYAVCFLQKAEAALRNKRSIYDKLVRILGEFNDGRLLLPELACQWKGLLENDVDNLYLITGLNPFLPKHCRIASSIISMPLGQAFLLKYADEALPKLGSDELASLAELLNEYSDEFLAEPVTEVIKDASVFLKGHPLLILKLHYLLRKYVERAVSNILS